MRFAFCALLMAGKLALASEVAGTWEGTLAKGAERVYAGFDLEVAGDRVKGDVYIEGWRSCTASDGHVEGDRLRFTAAGRQFTGVVNGKVMTLTVTDGASQETATLKRTESQATGPVSVDAAPKELEGKWMAHFVGRIGDRPKMIGEIEFDFHVDGSALSGVAHMRGWPGDCPMKEGTVANGRFSFTATGQLSSSSGIPVIHFEGEIHGKVLTLTMGHLFGADHSRWLQMDAVPK